MSKIICDVCGTAFAENAAQCPICGSAKRVNPAGVNGDTDAPEESGYKTTKGGRFSKRNVRKRNQEAARQPQPENTGDDQENEKSNKGLMILMFLLIGAVIAVVLYILLRLVGPVFMQPDPTTDPGTLPPVQTTDPTTAPTDPTSTPTDPTVPCDGLILNVPRIELNEDGATATIDVTATPADKTDPIQFSSSNEYVAQVDENGVVTAVGNGTATITVTCGQFHVDCTVVVDMPVTPTEEPTVSPTEEPTAPPTEEPTAAPTESSDYIAFYSDDITFFGEGEFCYLYIGDVDESDIYWYTYDDTVAIIDDGVVTAVGPGVTYVFGDYNGKTISCVVRCNWEAPDPTNPPLDPNETYTLYVNGEIPYWGYDVTIGIGESVHLMLCDSDYNVMDVDWQASYWGYVEIDGNWITGVDYINSSSFTVYVTVGDDVYSCVIRVQ